MPADAPPSSPPPLANALTWLRDSAVQVSGGEDAGGVHAWIDESSGEPSYLYSEIAGYFATLCLRLQVADPSGPWRERGERAADWLLLRARHENGLVLTRKYSAGGKHSGADDPFQFERGVAVLFDNAMVGRGLVHAFELTGEARFLNGALELDSLVRRYFLPEGAAPRWAWDCNRGVPLPDGPRWSQNVGPFQLKSATFFAALRQHADGPEHDRAIASIVRLLLPSQKPDGCFPNAADNERGATHLHPHFYAVEGLLLLAQELGRQDLIDAAARATNWGFRHALLETPQLQQWTAVASSHDRITGARSDILAQGLRAVAILRRLAPHASLPSDSDVAPIRAQLAALRTPRGGTAYGSDERGVRLQHANAWCHFFALDTLLHESSSASHTPLMIV